MAFRILEPGFYRQKCGGKVELFARREGWWYGKEMGRSGFDGNCWYETGEAYNGDGSRNLVAPWTEPKFNIGDRVRVNAPNFGGHGTRATIEKRQDGYWILSDGSGWPHFHLEHDTQPVEQWQPTAELRRRIVEKPTLGTSWVACDERDSGYAPATWEQKWTRGAEHEWREVPVS